MSASQQIIWKFGVQLDVFTLVMPWQSRIVHVGLQGELPYIWASFPSFDMAKSRVAASRTFITVKTGQEFDALRHIGTFIMPSYETYHVYETTRVGLVAL